jgi:hypothetical protein
MLPPKLYYTKERMSSSVFTLPYHYHILPLCLEPNLLSYVIYTHCNCVELVNPTMHSFGEMLQWYICVLTDSL